MFLATSYEAHEEMVEALAFEGRPLTWADQFATYADACAYYGADTSASLAGEDAFWEALAREEAMDAMEARGGPDYAFVVPYSYGDIPF